MGFWPPLMLTFFILEGRNPWQNQARPPSLYESMIILRGLCIDIVGLFLVSCILPVLAPRREDLNKTEADEKSGQKLYADSKFSDQRSHSLSLRDYETAG